MPAGLLTLQVVVYGIALWLGLYLIMRDPSKTRLHLAGWGLIAYGLSLAADTLSMVAATDGLIALFDRLHNLLIVIPPLLWAGAVLRLLPDDLPARRWAWRLWVNGFLPATLMLLLILAGADLPVGFAGGITPFGVIFAGLIVPPLLGAFILLIWYRKAVEPRRAFYLLLLGLMFFGLGVGMLISPLDWLPRSLLLPGMGVDLLLLGVATALHDAADEGEVLLPDMIRSLDAALLIGAFLGGQAALVMFLATGITFSMVILLLALITSAVLLVTLSDPIQAALDRLAFAAFPALVPRRDVLRAASQAASRVDDTLAAANIDPDKFDRLTRRVLGYMGDLPRLAKSPLTHLPLIDHRLAGRGIEPDTLARAAELKMVLTESIDRLKPRGQGDFGTTEEWRFYNALHWIYVRGLRPYSRRYAANGDLTGAEHQALDWFRAQVPERTLYNWQNAAARLVAQDIREQMDSP